MVPEGVDFGVAGVTAGPATCQDRDHSWSVVSGPIMLRTSFRIRLREGRPRNKPVRPQKNQLIPAAGMFSPTLDAFVRQKPFFPRNGSDLSVTVSVPPKHFGGPMNRCPFAVVDSWLGD